MKAAQNPANSWTIQYETVIKTMKMFDKEKKICRRLVKFLGVFLLYNCFLNFGFGYGQTARVEKM